MHSMLMTDFNCCIPPTRTTVPENLGSEPIHNINHQCTTLPLRIRWFIKGTS
jgi:hypothetical protein